MHASLSLDCQSVIPVKWAKVHPPILKLSRKKYSERGNNERRLKISPPSQVRCKSVIGPL